MAIKNILGNTNVRNYIAATKQPVNVMNTNKRGSASIVIDTSGSMNPYRDLLKRLICEFYDDVLKDPIASNILELSIITFNSDVFILQPMSEVKSQEKKGNDIDLHCEGLTLTGCALQAALLQLEQRIDQFRHTSPVIKYSAPILFLVSDGKPEYTPELRDQEEAAMAWSKDYIKEQVAANKLVVIAVEIGRNCNHALMQELTGLRDDRHVLRADNANSLVDFFKFSSSMLVTCSKFKNTCEELNETDLRDYKNFAEQ